MKSCEENSIKRAPPQRGDGGRVSERSQMSCEEGRMQLVRKRNISGGFKRKKSAEKHLFFPIQSFY